MSYYLRKKNLKGFEVQIVYLYSKYIIKALEAPALPISTSIECFAHEEPSMMFNVIPGILQLCCEACPLGERKIIRGG